VTGPRGYEAADRLKDGTPVVVRAIRPEDAAGVLGAFKSLDPQSVYTRFFTFKKGLSDAELTQITNVDFDRVVALVVTMPGESGEKLIGGGRYFADAAPDAARTGELAFMTADDCHGRGIASLILRHLTRIAREQGVTRFEADVLAQNQAMLAVFRRSGLPVRERPEGDAVHVSLLLAAPHSSP
jgi:RimJ/RimL family protein N-acetyltransferase